MYCLVTPQVESDAAEAFATFRTQLEIHKGCLEQLGEVERSVRALPVCA